MVRIVIPPQENYSHFKALIQKYMNALVKTSLLKNFNLNEINFSSSLFKISQNIAGALR